MNFQRGSGLLDALSQNSARHSAATLIIAFLCVAFSILGITRLRPDASLESMLSWDDPAAKAMARVMNNFGTMENLLLLVTLPESKLTSQSEPDISSLIAFADRFETAVQASEKATGLIDDVTYRVDPQTRRYFESVLIPAGLYYLDDREFEAFKDRLSEDQIEQQIRRNEAMIAAPGPAADALAKVILQDPLRLHEFIQNRAASQRPFDTFGGSDAFISKNGRSLLIRIAGKHPPGDLDFSARLTATAQFLAADVNTDALEIQAAGAYAIAAAAAESIRRDMIASVIGSVLCMQILFLLAYRNIFHFALAFLPVAVGILLGFGIYSLIDSDISPMIAVIGAVLAGLGIDYTVHFLSHYEMERSLGRSSLQAAGLTAARIGPALLAAWATTLIAFIAIRFSSVQALRDFALLGALGLTGTLAASFTVLPALLAICDRSGEVRSSAVSRLNVYPILKLLARYRISTMVVGIGLLMAALVVLLSAKGSIFSLESDLSVMHPKPNSPLDAQALIAERFGSSMDPMIVHLTADSPPRLVSLAHEMEDRLSDKALRIIGLSALLPDPSRFADRVEEIHSFDIDSAIARFNAAVNQSIFDPVVYEPYTEFLRRLFRNHSPPTIESLLPYRGLSGLILPRSAWMENFAPPNEAITLLFFRDPPADRASRDARISAVRGDLQDLPGVTLTGMSVLAHDTEQAVRQDLPRLLLIALVIVVLYLIVHFRNIGDTILALSPAAFGLAVLLAAMHLAGQKFNLINLIALPLLIGIDVDYGIFLVSLARARPQDSDPESDLISRIAPSCHAILICAATTIFGFGSLIFTSVPAIASLGFSVGIGVAASAVGTLFLVPVIFIRSIEHPTLNVQR